MAAVVIAWGLSVTAGFYSSRYDCGVCVDVLSAKKAGTAGLCSRYDSCHVINDTLTSCDEFCGRRPNVNTRARAQGASVADLRITNGFGTKPYGTLRLSVISPKDQTAPTLSINGTRIEWQYAEPFKYKWEDNALYTTVVARAGEVSVNNGPPLSVQLPPLGGGVAGVLIADPCVDDASITSHVACFYGKMFKTAERLPILLNTFVGNHSSSMDFWSILGDNFYDRTGEATKKIFSKISLQTKAKPLVTVPGNHDYWVLGGPEVSSVEDQYSNGFMQYYGQDTKAAQLVNPTSTGDDAVPFNFSIDPHKGHVLRGGNKPAISNSFLYNQIGNLGIVGFSGAYSIDATRPLMSEACQWLGKQIDLGSMKVAIITGHWDVSGAGAAQDMAVPAFYDEMRALPGCDELDKRSMLKFFMGHTHCNVPHPHGHVNTGFMVAGQGMEGCGNYGIPVIDTTQDRIRVFYFEVSNKNGTDQFDTITGCLNKAESWRDCVHLAQTWLDQPIVNSSAPENNSVRE